jgi:NhaP-type Na+/H+ or K+/H+ antiporter
VALAAALSLPPDFPHRARLLAMTYGAVLFTLLAQGLTIGPLVRRLGLRDAEAQPSTAGATERPPNPATYLAKRHRYATQIRPAPRYDRGATGSWPSECRQGD